MVSMLDDLRKSVERDRVIRLARFRKNYARVRLLGLTPLMAGKASHWSESRISALEADLSKHGAVQG